MKKQLLKILVLSIISCCAMWMGVACKEEPSHSHLYTEKVVNATYQANDATCTKKAEYYYSCSCGEKGTETFEFGTTIAHTFNQQVTTDKYKISDATCTEKARYHYSCVCGLTGENFFEYGNLSAHNYNQEKVEDDFKASDANCTQEAEYFYSCSCGACGTNTFSYGNALEHNFSNWEITTQPTCTTFGEETRECIRDSSHKETRLVSMLSHNYINQVIEDEKLSVYVHGGIEEIQDNAFAYCSIEKIVISKNVKVIGKNALCINSGEIHYEGTKQEFISKFLGKSMCFSHSKAQRLICSDGEILID